MSKQSGIFFSNFGCLLRISELLYNKGYWKNLKTIRDNSKLESVNITNCDKLTQLEAKIFSALPFLKSLNFHRSGLTSISEDAADWDSVEFFDFSQ